MKNEREKIILERLMLHKRVNVKELAKILYVSEPSVRRDLVELEKRHLLKRVHGGAVIDESGISELKIPFAIRELEQADAKVIIARKAIELINDGDVIFLDASSSAYNLISFLPMRKNLTVVTSGLKAMYKLAEYNINTVCIGGKLLNSCLSIVGEEAYSVIERINADAVFFSCRGLSEDGRLTDISEGENYIRKKMIACSKKQYLLCASEKLGKLYYHNLCSVSEITGIISEIPITGAMEAYQI